jgi:transcriptional regulator with XRE-family HTH domain
MTFAELLNKLRLKAEHTQESLARAAEVSLNTVRTAERATIPSFPVVVRLAAALGTDCKEFANCTDVAAGRNGRVPKKAATKKTPKK